MTNPILIPQPFANGGNKNDIQNTRQIGQDPEDATWEDGFPNVTMQPADVGGIPPKGLDFNGVFHALSGGIYFLQKGGRYQFDASLSPYPKNAIVQSDDGLKEFQSTIDNNSNNPNSNMTGWKLYAGDGFIVDALTSNDATKSLSAKQGNVLNTNKADKNDSRFGDAREWTATTVSQAEAETGTATTRRAWTAQRVRQAATAMFNVATTTFTRTLLSRTTAAQVRSDLELGTAATKNTGESSGNVLEVGSFGYGLRKALSPDDANTYFEGNRYAPNGSTAGAPPLGTAAYVTGTMYPSSKWSLLNWQNITNGRHFFKLSNASGVWGEWHEYLTSVNTTTDINGFLRGSGSANAVPETRTITAGTGLSGGGNLSANRTLSVNYGTTAGTAAQGNDSRLSNSREWIAETVSQAEAEAGTATTRRAWTAQRVRQAATAMFNVATTTFTRTLLSRSTAAQVRSDLELGTAAVRDLTGPNQLDDTSGRILKVGDFGVGVPVIYQAGVSIDEQVASGNTVQIHGSGTLPPNAPFSGAFKVLTIGSSSYPTQLGFDAYGGAMKIRTRVSGNGAFREWLEIYHEGNFNPSNYALKTYTDAELNKKLNANANAVSATKLVTARNIGGVSFDGTANINLPGVNIAGNQNTSGNAATATSAAICTGNASTATKLATARSVTLSGAVTGAFQFDGSSNVTFNTIAQNAIGVGQTWQDMKSSRSFNTTYTNSSGKPIMIAVTSLGGSSGFNAFINGKEIIKNYSNYNTAGPEHGITIIVPNGASYMFGGSGGLSLWWELR